LASISQARALMARGFMTQRGPEPVRSFTGRKIGDRQWTGYREGEKPRGSARLRAVRGLYYIQVMCTSIGEDAKGFAVQHVISTADLKLIEDLALICVRRIDHLNAKP